MGRTPLGPPWPKGHTPTEEERDAYRAYLQRNIAHSKTQLRVSGWTLLAVIAFCVAVAAARWLF